MEEKLLTIRDVAIYLAISEKAVIDLAESGTIPAYKIGGVYLRFRQDQVEVFRKASPRAAKVDSVIPKHPVRERILDFFYFNDFYIASAVIIIGMLVFIFRG